MSIVAHLTDPSPGASRHPLPRGARGLDIEFASDGRWPRFLLPRGEAAIRDCRVGFPSSLVSAVNWGRRRQSRRPLFLFQTESSLRHAGKGTAQAGAADRLHGAQITLSGNDHCFASAERFGHGNSSEVLPCAR